MSPSTLRCVFAFGPGRVLRLPPRMFSCSLKLIPDGRVSGELRSAPAEPAEIGFLLALEHCCVKGTAAQPKHTPGLAPDGRLARPGELRALNVRLFLSFLRR